jgi:hypothetical protein
MEGCNASKRRASDQGPDRVLRGDDSANSETSGLQGAAEDLDELTELAFADLVRAQQSSPLPTPLAGAATLPLGELDPEVLERKSQLVSDHSFEEERIMDVWKLSAAAETWLEHRRTYTLISRSCHMSFRDQVNSSARSWTLWMARSDPTATKVSRIFRRAPRRSGSPRMICRRSARY